MAHRLVEHVGEIELALDAESEAGLFAEAAQAFAGLVDGSEASGPGPVQVGVSLAARERPLLLVEWLSELVFLAEVEGFVPARVAAVELDGGRLRAALEGVLGRPRHLVKAVTLHGLELEREGEVWRGRVVFDV